VWVPLAWPVEWAATLLAALLGLSLYALTRGRSRAH